MAKKTSLYDHFVGEYVEIITKNVMVDGQGNAGPLSFQGYLLEHDNDMVALGQSPLEIDTLVKKDDVSAIHIEEVKDPYEEMLEEMDVSDAKGN